MTLATSCGDGTPGAKILILKPSSLGDVIHALPVLRRIKRHWRQSRVYWWVDTRLVDLLRGDPDLESVIGFERRRWATPQNLVKLGCDIVWMRRQEFDFVLDLQGLARSGAIAWLANARLSVGLDTPREGARGFYDVAVRRPTFHTHAVDWYLETLKWIGVANSGSFEWLPERREVAAAIRRKWDTVDGRLVLIQPGARWLDKRWPVAHYGRLVRALARSHPRHTFVLLGSGADRELCREVAAAEPGRCLDLSGQLNLLELVEWIRRGELMITNDTGPMHIAAALGRPIVALFGPTEPRRTGPYGQVSRVLQLDLPCVPCLRSRCRAARHMECLRSLDPALVHAFVAGQLSP